MEQSIVEGIDGIKSIISGRKYLLVRDAAYDFLEVKNFFDEYPHVEFSGFTPNPLYEQVCKGIDIFNTQACEMIVAVGGGSAIDVAKCIKLFCRMDSGTNYLLQDKFDSCIPLIAVPTTAGTGSESTRHAVIYFEGEKQSISHTSIVPDYAVLEPSVLKTLPVYQKKCTMLDALCQAIESWWSVNSNDESINYSRVAIQMIKDNWREYIFQNTAESAKNIMRAANYAGKAINITATTAAHAMSYKITSLYKLPHGHAVALCMPYVWEYMLENPEKCIDKRGVASFKATMDEIETLITLNDFKNMLESMKMNAPTSIDKENDLDILASSVNPIRLKNNPVGLSSDVLKDMYRRIVTE